MPTSCAAFSPSFSHAASTIRRVVPRRTADSFLAPPAFGKPPLPKSVDPHLRRAMLHRRRQRRAGARGSEQARSRLKQFKKMHASRPVCRSDNTFRSAREPLHGRVRGLRRRKGWNDNRASKSLRPQNRCRCSFWCATGQFYGRFPDSLRSSPGLLSRMSQFCRRRRVLRKLPRASAEAHEGNHGLVPPLEFTRRSVSCEESSHLSRRRPWRP